MHESVNDNQIKISKAEDIFIIMIQWFLKEGWERTKNESKAWLRKICNGRKKVTRPCIEVDYESQQN